jgi:hypothetical protein
MVAADIGDVAGDQFTAAQPVEVQQHRGGLRKVRKITLMS